MTAQSEAFQAGRDMTHREFFRELTDETLDWTPGLDACLRSYFWFQSSQPAESNPMEVLQNYGNSLGIAQSLHANGQISDRQLNQLSGFASRRMVEKLLPWNGSDFSINCGYGRPDGVTIPTMQ